jgi:HTH-type transcriptional regulator/antitoxin HipB
LLLNGGNGIQMDIRSIRDLAAVLHGRRIDLGLSQANLASRAGVSRKWVYELEAGKATAEFGLILRVLDALGLALDLAAPDDASTSSEGSEVDLDALLDEHRGR